ncbi:hypothetical protein F8279_25665 [Micromonospora sp. AMSO1212t]|uniref:Nitrate and nitrite sensing n=1 Tax=Micromonospora tulbaghiae TaxID=479978 RepID=A0ABY0KSC5_9ACTN|nr:MULTISPECIES: hypothetical protein [Micromonospora]KAB1902442.1 hypothetical protein F8279_25665 [Micromonospora sp. AMSO1212t]MDX5458445.1 hypothetical protein [Micromonospora tulbaghiae]SCF03821.1 hypothetical protein GA0070562_5439 [Micromonospora tulbaghiae]
MTVPASRVRRRPAVPGRTLALVLVLALLAPLGLIFVQAERDFADDHDLASRERLGVRYLRALGPITDALVEAQAIAVAEGAVSRASLAAAIERVAEVDNAVGDELRTHERWAGLRAKLESLPDRGIGDPEAAYRAYGEASDLLLALYRKVRESSGLIRDPRSDSFFLQDGIGGDLPTATVLAGRLVDLARLSAKRPAAERARVGAELAELRVSALGPATDLVADLRSAVDSSESTDLGANVLTPLDTYQRSLETFAVYSAPGAGRAAPGTDQLTRAGISAQNAAKQLRTVILDQLDALLRERLDALERDRLLGRIAAGAALALIAGIVALHVAALRRDRSRATPARREPAEAASPPTVHPEPPLTAPGADRQPVAVGHGGDADRWRPFDAAR